MSLSFLYSTTLASALYLVLLRFLARQYSSVVQLVDTVSSDTDLTFEENNSFQFIAKHKNSVDLHPDAHACRLKVGIHPHTPKEPHLKPNAMARSASASRRATLVPSFVPSDNFLRSRS